MTDVRSLEVPNRSRLYKTLSDPKSERELLSVLLKVSRDEKREEVEAEQATKELSSKSSKTQPDSKSAHELYSHCPAFLQPLPFPLVLFSSRKNRGHCEQAKQPDPKSARELLSLCSKLLRVEEKEARDSEDAIKTLGHMDSKTQPVSKKQTILGEENLTSRLKNNGITSNLSREAKAIQK